MCCTCQRCESGLSTRNPYFDHLKRLLGLSSLEHTQQEAASQAPSLEQGLMEHTLRKLVCKLFSMFKNGINYENF